MGRKKPLPKFRLTSIDLTKDSWFYEHNGGLSVVWRAHDRTGVVEIPWRKLKRTIATYEARRRQKRTPPASNRGGT